MKLKRGFSYVVAISALIPTRVSYTYAMQIIPLTHDAFLDKDSRSLNTTAIPNLNLASLRDLKLSKAHQLALLEAEKKPALHADVQFKILNNTLKKPSFLPITILNRQANEFMLDVNAESEQIKLATKRPASTLMKNSSPKKIKNEELMLVQHEVEPLALSVEEVKRDEPPKLLNPCFQKGKTPEPSVKDKEEPKQPAQSKLLALIEVTPDQYQKLNEKLSAAERNEKLDAFVALLVDNEKGSENCK